ncbi:hypothetical protein ACW9UR_14525 [Halovulum sp. GXIMD14794]
MNWTQAVDHYCERTAPGFGAEPLNMATGLVFAVLGLWLAFRASGSDVRATALTLILVGVSSFLWHGFGQIWASMLNLVTNMALMAALGWVALHRLGGARQGSALVGGVMLAVIFYQAGPILGEVLPGMSAAGGYILMILLTLLAAVALRRFRRPAGLLAVGAALLAAGLPFRLNDAAWCGTLSTGTHFAWHLLNAAYMALLLAASLAVAETRTSPGGAKDM